MYVIQGLKLDIVRWDKSTPDNDAYSFSSSIGRFIDEMLNGRISTQSALPILTFDRGLDVVWWKQANGKMA